VQNCTLRNGRRAADAGLGKGLAFVWAIGDHGRAAEPEGELAGIVLHGRILIAELGLAAMMASIAHAFCSGFIVLVRPGRAKYLLNCPAMPRATASGCNADLPAP
jgi:hypothetical protein